MTFSEWWTIVSDHDMWDEGTASAAWNAALEQAKEIIEDMDGCTDVQYCKRDGLKQLEELR